ncbi:MAG: hypothetical protein AB1402_04000 [Bacillota bacterium]
MPEKGIFPGGAVPLAGEIMASEESKVSGIIYNGAAEAPSKGGTLMKVLDYTMVVWKETEGYVSKCPELGVASAGDTISEAVENLKEAVELYLENAKILGLVEDIEESLTTKEKFISRAEVTL